MKITLLTLCWNERDILPYFLNYYSKFCDKIVVYDNYSTDDSVEIIKSFPNTEVRFFESNNIISNTEFLRIKNNEWKEFRDITNLQIVLDCDEFIYSPNGDVRKDLERYYKVEKHSVITTIGYNMIGKEFIPFNGTTDIVDIYKYGVRAPGYGKSCIFDPKRIEDINYVIGGHMVRPTGDIQVSYPELYLLHYRFFGFEHWKKRNTIYNQRVGEDRGAEAYPMWDEKIKNKEDWRKEFITEPLKKIIK